MFGSILIANRGEIACRIIATARRMGLRTTAVYSDADAGARHVRLADMAVRLGPPPASQSYLDIERVLMAAGDTDADAIHPGYGFLSENADFAEAVIASGRIWIGPPPDAIRAMGRKDRAKQLMAAAGVPVTPGWSGDDQSPARLAREAQVIGWPVLIKAVAGGGGKGMRLVERVGDFPSALESCRREAAAAFGDDRVLLEHYVTCPRHIEVQIFADSHGDVVHLFERDCSVQRRHQKVIEEAPAPGMDLATRAALCAAAIQAARAVDYVGAGTVEFIAEASAGLRADRLWFMEMNTRLQVEHPVTEAITGVDLVEWQLRIAAGESLPSRQDEIAIKGHAVEARLYAEDPARGFLPSTGRLDHLKLPSSIRIDSGVQEGDRIGPFYDPMIAKLVSHAPTREKAVRQLAEAARSIEIWPVRSNAAFLARVLHHPEFMAGQVDTAFIGRHAEALVPSRLPSDEVLHTAAQALLLGGSGPWQALTGFRAGREPEMTMRLRHDGDSVEIDLRHGRGGSGLPVTPWGHGVLVHADGQSFLLTPDRVEGEARAEAADGAIFSPMPGRVIAVAVRRGQKVARGTPLVTLEAMKMEHQLTAPFNGEVAEIAVSEGVQVAEAVLLVRIDRDGSVEEE